MALSIVRNDITKMMTEAIVNTANDHATVGTGCDMAIYRAAGYDELLTYRKERIGFVPEGEAFITPGFNLMAKYIIHAVSPHYYNGNASEEEKLRSCYRNSLKLVKEYRISSIAFPLISTGGFGYPKEEGLRIAVDEINAFLAENEMLIVLVVFDEKSNTIGKMVYPGLEEYIDHKYVQEKTLTEYSEQAFRSPSQNKKSASKGVLGNIINKDSRPGKRVLGRRRKESRPFDDNEANTAAFNNYSLAGGRPGAAKNNYSVSDMSFAAKECSAAPKERSDEAEECLELDEAVDFEGVHESKLEERMRHMSDTFSEYLMYIIREKNMQNAEVYKRAIVDKKIFSKIKNNVNYHPQKLTALCLCVGAKLNLDESKDLLSRAGYALSPCDKTDIIFSYFIENEIYDMIELDIQLEEHGLPCIIS